MVVLIKIQILVIDCLRQACVRRLITYILGKEEKYRTV